MAFLAGQDDKQLQGQDQAQGGQATVQGGQQGVATALTNQGDSFVSNGSPIQGGQGGMSSGWTNIQSYLKANQGHSNSSKLLQNEVGTQFDADKSKLETTANQAKTQAETQVTNNKIAPDAASQLIQQAGSNYQYTGDQNDNYKQAVSKVSGSLNAKYQGPQDYTFAFDDKTQQYGTGMGQDDTFSQIMRGIYNKASNGQISRGGHALQEQLDLGNEEVQATRADLGDRYKVLNQMAFGDGTTGGLVADTDRAVKNAISQFTTDQTDLRNYLGQEKDTNYKAVDDRAAGLQAAENAFKQHHKDVYSTNFMGAPDSYVYQYTGGPAANLENATQVDRERNQYNALLEMLGIDGGKINRAADYDLGDIKQTHNWSLWGNPQTDELMIDGTLWANSRGYNT